MDNNAKLFVGPVSKNVVDVIIEEANISNKFIGLIPSRRQVDFDNGYVNNWRTKDFVSYVRERSDRIIIVRDHGGPNQGKFVDDGKKSLLNDVKESFDIIHIDPWKKFTNLEKAFKETAQLINQLSEIKDNICFEVGTEEAIRGYSSRIFDQFLNKLRLETKKNFAKVKYGVIQSGTKLEINSNIGIFDKKKSIEFLKVCKKYNIYSKEHNGDYLSIHEIKKRFELGLSAINIAPEFGFIETKCILEEIERVSDKVLYDKLFEICYESKNWVKWIPKDKVNILLMD